MDITTWTPIGGFPENPGAWSDNNGGYIFVAQRDDGVIRRQFRPLAGRGEPSTVYTCDQRDGGGPCVPDGVPSFDSAERAWRHAHPPGAYSPHPRPAWE